MNTVRTYLKRRARSRVQFHDELPEGAAVSLAAPDGAVIQAEVQTALASLSPQLRAAIVLVCLQEQPASHAAEIEGCSTDTMYWRVHEARRQLKQRLAEHLS
jgi:DNA-directed RNA polymerase specialized sigma24 family protein